MTSDADNLFISVVVPVFNEAGVVAEFYRRSAEVLAVHNISAEIIFVDDGSADDTLSIIRELSRSDSRVKALSFSRNFGHSTAISAGLDHACGDAVVVIDADLQDPPELIPSFVNKWREGYQVVYGVRTKRKEWFVKRFSYWLFYRIFSRLSVLSMPLDAGDFSLLDRTVVDLIKSLPERNRFLRGLRSWAGFEQVGIGYERGERFGGVTKYSLGKLVKLAADGVFSFSYIPLRLASLLGFFVASVALAIILFVLYLRIRYGIIGVPGFTSIIITVLFVGGVELIAIGVLGEYVARVYEEVKRRPLYVMKEKIGFPR